jgi:hypothetical protein
MVVSLVWVVDGDVTSGRPENVIFGQKARKIWEVPSGGTVIILAR